MQFYQFTGTIINEKWAEENDDRRVLNDRVRKIAKKSRAFNQKLQDKAYFFVADACDDTALIGGIVRDPKLDVPGKLSSYLDALKLQVDPSGSELEEVTFESLCNMLRTSDRCDYIRDDDKILEKFGIDKLCGGYSRDLEYGENMIEPAGKAAVYDTVSHYLVSGSFEPELDRIYAKRAGKPVMGHPVHYMVETDDRETRKVLYRTLLQALYANGRISNRRYCFLDLKPGDRFSMAAYDCLYYSCIGGTVIVRYQADDNAEDNYADAGQETIEMICEVMQKYRHQVLTVICLPRECTGSKAIFYANLGNTSIVELREEFASGEKACEFLKMLAKEIGVRTDKKLFSMLEEDETYLAPDLHNIFDEWYNDKLKTGIYPQYKEIACARKKTAKEASKGSAYDELSEMIGLGEAKKVIDQALDYFKAQKLFKDKGMKSDLPAMHMVFTGNPGTAKTTVARLFARIMKDNGLLSIGKCVECGRGDLVGRYVGWTAPTIQRKFSEAKGSVLFIDEAYSLVDDRSGSFGDEAINTIVQEMENHREDLIVIFAGYPDKMEGFLNKNPGLRSRIAFHVPFDDYNTEDLCGIARLIAKKKGLTLTDEAVEKLGGIFDAAKTQVDFGNGRYVRNVIEKARMAQASRLLAMDYDSVRKKDIETICAEDIEAPVSHVGQQKKPIGFCA